MKSRMKKLLTSGMLLAALTLSAQSAFATIGFGDTRAEAVLIKKYGSSSGAITSSKDVDWYKYDNRTGESIVVALESPAGKNYDFDLIYISANGVESPKSTPTDFGQGGTDVLGIQLGLGDQVYIKVYGHTSTDHDPTKQYKLTIY
ncbi:hypothetical protein ACFLFF_20435 [Brevibacillus reuszeri]|uniref:hypothetical protein n=1 Tax=Brevibacillus reuszeri TaxID=54915 RepID=UPI00366D506D